MGKITATKEYIKDVLGISNLRIPEYQRPYRWNDTNVRQLLEDIKSSFLSGKKHYLVGSVILHDNKKDNSFDIVDGQQRLTTLLLIQMKCSEITQKQYTPSNLTYNSNSYNCIQNNYQFLKEWFAENVNGQVEEYWHYILENCQFVKIVVDDLSEAFQMFDSQNGRGKELAAYNLLKAYHIKAMEQNSFEEKKLCDMRWEQATQYDIAPSNIQTKSLDLLDQLFGEQLYRSRLWCKKENAKRFSKKKISEFKGFTIDKNHPIQYAFQNPQLLQYLTEKFYHSVLEGTIGTQSRFATGDSENINPFVNINQAIVNGKSFFDYIETYVEIYKRMFLQVTSFQLSEFKLFYYRYCLNYNPDAVFPTDKKGVESAHNAVGYEAIQLLVVQAALAVGHVPRPCRPVCLLATEKRIAHILQIQIEPEAHAVFLAQGIDSSQTTALACIVRVLEYLKRIFRVRAVSSIAEYPVVSRLHQQLAIVLTIPFRQIVEIHILYKVVKPIQYVF